MGFVGKVGYFLCFVFSKLRSVNLFSCTHFLRFVITLRAVPFKRRYLRKSPNERHWLVIAVAILWQVTVEGAVDANLPISSVDELPPNHIARRNFKHRRKNRLLSCFRRGYLVIKAAFLNHLTLPQGSFFPEPWPTFTPKPNVSQITFSSA